MQTAIKIFIIAMLSIILFVPSYVYWKMCKSNEIKSFLKFWDLMIRKFK